MLNYEDFKQSLKEESEVVLEEGAESSMSDKDLDSAIARTVISFAKMQDNMKLAAALNAYLTEKLKRAK